MSAPLLSVVIPTYNEAANIAPLLQALRSSLAGVDYEAVVVDDNSKDATAANARAEGARVIVRTTERGLATAVVKGIRESAGAYVAVMDADFQHPPETIRKLLEKAQAEDADVVIGSRYAEGGSEGNFGPLRRLISGGASLIGKLALPPIRKFGVTDPMSGLFLVRRAAVDCDALRPHGYKILLEILGRTPLRKVAEVGYTFQDRRGGESKLGAGVIVQYVQHVAILGRDHPENRRAAKFLLVGLSGVLVNLGLLWLLHGRLGLHDLIAVPIAVEASIISNFLLNDRWTFHDRRHDHVLERLGKFNAVSLLALAINVSAYAILTRGLGVYYLLAQLIAIAVAFGANYLGNLHWTYGGERGFSLKQALRTLAAPEPEEPPLPEPALPPEAPLPPATEEERRYAMLLHVSSLPCLFLLGGLTFVGPLTMWLLRRKDSPFIDVQGRMALRFHVATLIILFIAGFLLGAGLVLNEVGLLVFGILAMLGLLILQVAAPLLAAKAVSDGRRPRYPFVGGSRAAQGRASSAAFRFPPLRSQLVVAAILAIGGSVVYFDDIDRVPELYFDEHYYVTVGRQIDNGIWEDPCWIGDQELDHRPLNYEHPPLAKLLIAWSVIRFDTDHAVFEGCRSPDDANPHECNLVEGGEVISTHESRKACYDAYTQRAKEMGNPVAWRLPSALLGVATVVFIGLAGQRLFGTAFAGLLAGTLVLLDTLVYTSARMAILDIFATGFLAMAIYAATFPSRKGVVWTAALLGLAFSCKYSVAFAGPAVALLSLWSQRRAGQLNRRRFDLNLAAFILVPLAIWLLTYLPWWRIWIPDMGVAGAFSHWIDVQKAAFDWGATGFQVHAYATPPEEWIPIIRPTFYYHVWGFGDGTEGWVYAVGNPLLWWSFSIAALTALLSAVFGWVRARVDTPIGPFKWFAQQPRDEQAVVLASLLAASTYGFFFLPDRVVFIFYMTLVVPLGCLALAGMLHLLWQRGAANRIAVAIVVVAILAAALYYLPVASADRIDPEHFHRIMRTVPWMRE